MAPIMLAPNFSLEELTRGERGPFTPSEIRNLRATAALAQTFRDALGVPMDVSNGLRRPAHNAAVTGSSNTSQHMDGTALDFVPRGISQLEAYRRIKAAKKAGKLPTWGELIFYPFPLPNASSGHLHLSLPTRKERDVIMVRINEAENAGAKYAALTSSWLARFPGYGNLALILVAAAVLFLLLFPEISRRG